jgi:hypothetical protein
VRPCAGAAASVSTDGFGDVPTVENRWVNREAHVSGITNVREADG